jgi:hypothetical protein
LISYLINYKSIEGFVSLRESHGLDAYDKNEYDLILNKPFTVKSKNIDLNNSVDIRKPLKFEDNESIAFKDNIIMHSSQSLYFNDNKDANNRLSHDDLLSIKKNTSKIKYLKGKSEAVLDVNMGNVDYKFPGNKASGNNECTSKLWDIATGNDVDKLDFCRSCCKDVQNNAVFKSFISLDHTIHKMIQLDLTHGINYTLLSFENTNTNNFNDLTISFFRNNMSFDCKLQLINVSSTQVKNDLQSKTKLEDVTELVKESYIVKSFSSSSSSQTDTLVEWGAFENNVYISTTEHMNSVAFNFVLLSVESKFF